MIWLQKIRLETVLSAQDYHFPLRISFNVSCIKHNKWKYLSLFTHTDQSVCVYNTMLAIEIKTSW